jgi:DNA transposition AAA+ family ATPase
MADEKEKAYNGELYRKFFSLVGEGKKTSQARAGRELGVSGAVISAYKNRNYNGNVAALEDKIQAFLEREERRVSNIVIPVVETATIENMRTAVEMAHDYKDIAVAVGEAGTGKTTAVERYAADNPGAAFIVYAYPGMSQQKLAQEIARTLGLPVKGGKAVLIDRIADELSGRDAVVIIDQADYLTDATLELLRCVIVAMAGAGLVLVGLPRLEGRLRNVRDDHEQLLSRVGTLLKVQKMKAEDAARIVRGVWAGADDGTVAALAKAAGGSVRTLVKLIERTHRIMAASREDAPNAGMVAAASELVMRQA